MVQPGANKAPTGQSQDNSWRNDSAVRQVVEREVDQRLTPDRVRLEAEYQLAIAEVRQHLPAIRAKAQAQERAAAQKALSEKVAEIRRQHTQQLQQLQEQIRQLQMENQQLTATTEERIAQRVGEEVQQHLDSFCERAAAARQDFVTSVLSMVEQAITNLEVFPKGTGTLHSTAH